MISNLPGRIERLTLMLPRGDNAQIATGTMKVFLLKIIGIGLLFIMEFVIARVIGRAAFGRFVFVLILQNLLFRFSSLDLIPVQLSRSRRIWLKENFHWQGAFSDFQNCSYICFQ